MARSPCHGPAPDNRIPSLCPQTKHRPQRQTHTHRAESPPRWSHGAAEARWPPQATPGSWIWAGAAGVAHSSSAHTATPAQDLPRHASGFLRPLAEHGAHVCGQQSRGTVPRAPPTAGVLTRVSRNSAAGPHGPSGGRGIFEPPPEQTNGPVSAATALLQRVSLWEVKPKSQVFRDLTTGHTFWSRNEGSWKEFPLRSDSFRSR